MLQADHQQEYQAPVDLLGMLVDVEVRAHVGHLEAEVCHFSVINHACMYNQCGYQQLRLHLTLYLLLQTAKTMQNSM